MYYINGSVGRIEHHTNIFLSGDAGAGETLEWKERLDTVLQHLPSRAERLKPLVQLIVATLSPSKIFMLEQKGCGTEHHYTELLIMIPDNGTASFGEMDALLEIAVRKDRHVVCSLHNQGSVIQALRKGHLFYTLHCRPENIIYDDERTSYPVATTEVLETLRHSCREKFFRLFEKPRHFYETALVPRQRQDTGITAFLLHQAAELAYRAVLQSLTGQDKKTHEIRMLKKHARRCAPQMSAVFPEDTGEDKRFLHWLDRAYLASRYEEQYPVTNNDLALLFEKVKLLHQAAREAVESTLGQL